MRCGPGANCTRAVLLIAHVIRPQDLATSFGYTANVKSISFILAAFLLIIQAQLWLGKGSLPRGAQLREELAKAQSANEQARGRNAQIEAELRDLREGLEMVEEKARNELGMIKPDEIYVQVRR